MEIGRFEDYHREMRCCATRVISDRQADRQTDSLIDIVRR